MTVTITTPPGSVDEWEVITLVGTAVGATSIEIGGSGYMAIVDVIGFEEYGVQLDQATGSWEATILFLDDAGGTISHVEDITITAYGGIEPASATTSIVVYNVEPEVSASLNAVEINEGDEVEVSVTITDQGLNDGHSLTIDWGEGDPETVSWPGVDVDPNLQQRIVAMGFEPLVRQHTFTHTYLDDNPTATPGDDYTITVAVSDDDTGSHSSTHVVTVKIM